MKPIVLDLQGAWPIRLTEGGMCGSERKGGVTVQLHSSWPMTFTCKRDGFCTAASVLTRKDARALYEWLGVVLDRWSKEAR